MASPLIFEQPVTTRALVLRNGSCELTEVPIKALRTDEVLIRVRAVGICRTDLYVVRGKLPMQQTILTDQTQEFVPGHEFSGTIEQVGVGLDQSHYAVGSKVVVNPIRACDTCEDCLAGNQHQCQHSQFMGVDFSGCCRELVAVRASQVFTVSETLSFAEASFAEPVAAALAVVKTGIGRNEKGLVLGDSRIAQLTNRVLQSQGFANTQVVSLANAAELEDNAFDFVIETEVSTAMIRAIPRLIRPRGTVILKSRKHEPFHVTLSDWIRKEPILRIVNYGRFEDAVRLLSDRQVRVDDLVGKRFAFEEHEHAFALAERSETKKTFLMLGDD